MKFVYTLNLGIVILAIGCPLYGASSSQENNEHLKKELAAINKAMSGSNAVMQLDLSREDLTAKLKTIAVMDLPRYLLRLVEELERNKGYHNLHEALKKIGLVCAFIHEKFSANPHPAVDRTTANKLEFKDCEAEGYCSLVVLLNKCVVQPDSVHTTSSTTSTPQEQIAVPKPATSNLLSEVRNGRTLRPTGERQAGTQEPRVSNGADALSESSMLGALFGRIKNLVGQGEQRNAAPPTSPQDTGRAVSNTGRPLGNSRTTATPSQGARPISANEDDDDGDDSQPQQNTNAAAPVVQNAPPPPPQPSRPVVKPAAQASPEDRSQLLASIQAGAALRSAKDRKLAEKVPHNENVSQGSPTDAITKAIKEGAGANLRPAGNRKLSEKAPSQDTPMEAITREIKERNALKEQAVGAAPQASGATNVTNTEARAPQQPQQKQPGKGAAQPKAPPLKDKNAGSSSRPPVPKAPVDDPVPIDNSVSPALPTSGATGGTQGSGVNSPTKPASTGNQNGPLPSGQNPQILKHKDGLQIGKVLALTGIVGLGAWAFKTYYWDPKYSKYHDIAAPSA